jgi:hypothetical protein
MTNQTRAPTIDDSVDPVNGRIFKQGELWVNSDKVFILSNFDSNNKPVWVMITSANTVSDIVDGSISITKLQGNQITTAGLPNCLVKTDTNGNIKASGNIISTNNITSSNIVTGNITVSGNITASNLSATNTMTNKITAVSGTTVDLNGFRINNYGTNMDLTVSAADDCNLWLNSSGIVYYRADSDNDLTGTKIGHVFKSSQQDIMYVGNTSIDCLRPIRTSRIISSNNITFGNPVIIENLPSGVVRSNNNTLTTGNVDLSEISQSARTTTGEASKLVEINANEETTIKKLKTDNIMLNSSNITISNVIIQDKNVKLQSISPVDSSQEIVVNGHFKITGFNELRMGHEADSRIILWDGRYNANVDLRLPDPNLCTYAYSVGHMRLLPSTYSNYQTSKWGGAEKWVMNLNTISPNHGLFITHGELANSKSDKYVIDAAFENNTLYVNNINPLTLGSNITLGNVAITNINEVNSATALNVNCGNIKLNGTVHLDMADGVLAVSNKKIVSTDAAQATLPFGIIMAYAGGVSIPAGWVECNGQTVQDRSGTNFMVPDLRGLSSEPGVSMILSL